jgi:hypothetical protein
MFILSKVSRISGSSRLIARDSIKANQGMADENQGMTGAKK